MTRLLPVIQTVVLVGSVLAGGMALGADPSPSAPAPGVTPAPPPPPTPGGPPPAAMPPPAAATPADAPPAAPNDFNRPPASATATPAGVVAHQPGDDNMASDHSYGFGARGRLVSVPAFMLNLFTKKNVPLTSYATALEVFRRGQNFDVSFALGYQNMSPGDGNWLGRGKDAAVDTDFVQFRGLSFISADASFIWRTMFNEWFGMHYGAGIGIGIVRGKMLRTSNSGCTEANAGNTAACRPIVCPPAGCSEATLKATEGGGVDEVGNPHRFADPDVPGAIPIVNVVVGATFKIPNLRGWEARLEGGFYDAFFLGAGVAYVLW
jgi:hypothetical protein